MPNKNNLLINIIESMPYTINYHDWDYDEMESVNVKDINPNLLNKIKQLPKFKLYNIHPMEIFSEERKGVNYNSTYLIRLTNKHTIFI